MRRLLVLGVSMLAGGALAVVGAVSAQEGACAYRRATVRLTIESVTVDGEAAPLLEGSEATPVIELSARELGDHHTLFVGGERFALEVVP